MPYSTHAQLVRLLDDIDAYTWKFDNLRFYGKGINDLLPYGVGKSAPLGSPIAVVVKVINVAPTAWGIEWSDNNGSTWRETNGYVIGTNYIIGRVSLDYGIAVEFAHDISVGHYNGDYWQFTANPPDSTTFRDFANDWVNINLERTHPVPFTAPVNTVVLAEATYAIYLILRANNDPRSAAFHQEAVRLITLLTTFKTVTVIPEAVVREEVERPRGVARRKPRAAGSYIGPLPPSFKF